MRFQFTAVFTRSRAVVAILLLFLLTTCKTGFADVPAPGTSEVRPQFSKLQFDRWGRLYALGPDRKTLSRILVRDSGVATQTLLTRQDPIDSFASTDTGFVIVSNRKVLMLDRGGKPQNQVAQEWFRELLDDPVAVTYSANQRIYVLDQGENRVWVFGRNGVPLFSFGDDGERKNRLREPFAIFVDRYEHIYVLERKGDGQVEVFSHNGKWLQRLKADALNLAPFNKPRSISPMVDQAGSVFALAADSKTFVRIDWRSNARTPLDKLVVTVPDAIAFENGQVVYETSSKVQLRSIRNSLDKGEPGPILPNVVSTNKVAANCDSVSTFPDGGYLCLHRRQGRLVKYSMDGKPLIRYGGKMDKPFLLSRNKDKIAVVDRTGIMLFTVPGKLLGKIPVDSKIQAIDLHNSHLFVVTNHRLVKMDFNGAESAVNELPPGNSIGSRTRLLAIDSLENIYTVDKNGDTVFVNKLHGKSTEKISVPGIKKIIGLQVDGDNQLYVLTKGDRDGTYIHVYHGSTPQFVFRVGRDVEPSGFSINPGNDSLVSVYDKDQSRVLNFQYQQVPTPIFQLPVTADADKVLLAWLRSPETYVTGYRVEATDARDSPFVQVASTPDTGIDLILAKKRYRYFRIRGVSKSGIAGYPSGVFENKFEKPFQVYKQNDYHTAINGFRNLSLQEPWALAANHYLARSLINANQNIRALGVLGQSQSLNNGATETIELRAHALYNLGRYKLANIELNRILSSGKPDTEVYLLCAQIKQAVNETRAARSCMKSVIAAQPDNPGARIMLLDSYDAKKDRKDIKTQLDWLSDRAIKNQDIELMHSLADYYTSHRSYADSVKWLKRDLKIRPGDLSASVKLIEATLAQKHLNEARRLSLELISKPGSRFDGYKLLGRISLAENRFGEAVLSFRKAVELDPSDNSVQLSLAKSYRHLGNLSQARDALNIILAVEPSNAEAHLEMAQVLVHEKNTGGAIDELYKVLHYKPNNMVARKQLAELLESTGKLQQATVQYQHLNHDSPSEKYVAKLAALYFKRGRFRLALGQYKTLLSRQRNSRELNTQVGIIYHRLGQNLLARKFLEKAVHLNRKSQSALVSLAGVYSDLHLYKLALRSARAAYKQKSSADNRLLVESIKARAEDYKKSRAHPASLRIDKFVVNRVYGSAVTEKSVSVGKLVLTNRGTRDILNGTIRVYVGDFVDAGLTLPLPVVKAKATIVIPLPVNLSNHANEFTEDQVKTATIEVEYAGSKDSRVLETSGLIQILGLHAVDWESQSSINYFLARPVANTARFPRDSDERNSPNPISLYLAPLVDAYSEIADYSIDTQESPDAEKRYIQFPDETLHRHQGSNADLALLFAAKLLASEHRVAVTGTIVNPVLLFDTGKNWDQRADLELADSALYQFEGNAWIPLAISKWKNGINDMWRTGSRWAASASGSITINIPATATDLQGANAEQEGFARTASNNWSRWFEVQQTYSLQKYLEQNSSLKNGSNGTPLQQAQWYAKHNFHVHALQMFNRALQENPYSYDSAIEAGDVSMKIGKPARALEYYRRATMLEPFDKTSRDKIKKVGAVSRDSSEGESKQ